MEWNWTKPDWPDFTYDEARLVPLEMRFLLEAGEVSGALKRISGDERDLLRVELLSDEAVKTSEIEGEMLDRRNIQASLRHLFGLEAAARPVKPEEQGAAEVMADLYRTATEPLDHETLFGWHRSLMRGNRQIGTIGAYRAHESAMQIVSGRLDNPTVHYEAPPSARVLSEMGRFVDWFNLSAADKRGSLPPLTRAGIGHLYFESIHPFEDGNGRIGRALAVKSLEQGLEQPSLIALACTIERNLNAYYDHLSGCQKTLDITDWLIYFAETILEAQQATLKLAAFHIGKARFYERLRDRFNDRQEKAVARLFREGPAGFKGGLSAENYVSITRASRETATVDLQDLVEKGALLRTGESRQARYWLNLPPL